MVWRGSIRVRSVQRATTVLVAGETFQGSIPAMIF